MRTLEILRKRGERMIKPKWENIVVTSIVTIILTFVFFEVILRLFSEKHMGKRNEQIYLDTSGFKEESQRKKTLLFEEDDIFEAMKAKDYSKLKTLIDICPESLILTDHECDTILHKAVKEGNEELIGYLLKRGASSVGLNSYGETPLLLALKQKNHVKILKIFLENGVDINDCGKYEPTILRKEVYEGDGKETVAFLLANGADVNARNGCGATPLFYAVLEAKPEIVSLLISRGADVNAKLPDNQTPLHLVMDTESEKILIASGAEINKKRDFGETPLHYILRGSHPGKLSDSIGDIDNWIIERAKVLLENGADINAVTSGGMTPLHCAVIYERTRVVKFLVYRGADITIRDEYGETPLSYAIKRLNLQAAAFLAFHELKKNKVVGILLLFIILGILCLVFYRLFLKKNSKKTEASGEIAKKIS